MSAPDGPGASDVAALLELRFDRPDVRSGVTAPLTVGRLSATALAGLVTSVALLGVYRYTLG